VLLQHYYVANIIFHSRVCAFSALYMHSKFRHHPRPLGYLCVKFCFFRDLHSWASPWKKLRTQSLTQFIWFPENRSLRFGI